MTNKTVCTEDILKCCLTALKCPRGKFYPDKNFGSHILSSVSNAETDKLLSYARQALSEIDGVFVKSVEINSNNAVFTIFINDVQRQVTISNE